MDERLSIINARTASHAYRIAIGERALDELARTQLIASADRVAVVVSSRVYGLHRARIDEALAGVPRALLYEMNDGEEFKNYGYAESFLDRFVRDGMNRRSAVVGIGGGVVGDFSGFLASVYMRGIPVVHVPTTLLSMVDSSIGGKVAVNLSVGKNIVGVFHQPRAVFMDVRFLETLPDAEMKNGLAEIVKHGFIGETGTLDILEKGFTPAPAERETLRRLIILSAGFKASVVEKDEKEADLRAILNFGHTVGHAIESCLEYSGVSHGQAVARGMRVAGILSERLGLLPPDEAARLYRLLDRLALEGGALPRRPGDIMEHMKYDKKNFGGAVNFVLLRGLGEPMINRQVDPSLLSEVLAGIIGEGSPGRA